MAYGLEGLVYIKRQNEVLDKSSIVKVESGIGTDFSHPGHTHYEEFDHS
jgi:hypothetical protein